MAKVTITLEDYIQPNGANVIRLRVNSVPKVPNGTPTENLTMAQAIADNVVDALLEHLQRLERDGDTVIHDFKKFDKLPKQ